MIESQEIPEIMQPRQFIGLISNNKKSNTDVSRSRSGPNTGKLKSR